MVTASICNAVERGLRCNATPPPGSKWCHRHEELQAKSLKTYKRFSFELEAFEECQVNIAYIKSCECPEELHELSECIRKKWVLTQRTVDARIKHHTLFYAGGDVSHQAFIDNLTKQKALLEEKLLKIDERAYELLKRNEQAGWLDHQAPADPVCDELAPMFPSKFSIEAAPAANLLSPASDISSDGEASQEGRDDGAEDVFSDVESGSASSNSCTSTCCEDILVRPLTYRARVLAYLNFPSYFNDEADQAFSAIYMDNIFRYVISRIPSLLVRAKGANCPSIACFLESEDLREEEFARLWRGLKYNNVHAEGKISVNAVRNSICDADCEEEEERKGPCLELLGGKVWKDACQRDLSRRAWDHFYRFTSCSGCALSVTYSFKSWNANRLLAQPHSRYPAWFDEQDGQAERIFRSNGVVVCGSYRKGRLGSMEHVRPKKKGMRSVWIERETRNWAFLRMISSEENTITVSQLGSAKLAVHAWPHQKGLNTEPDSVTWVSRLRSGYNATDRRNARWTTEATFHYTDKTHERLLSASPESYFHKGKAFSDASLDVLIIDTGNEQSYEKFILHVADRFAKSATDLRNLRSGSDVGLAQESPVLDRALYLARNMFREQS